MFTFWKGFMWAAAAAKIGFKWMVGNGRKIKFWEDNWLGSSSLAIQFWDVYVIVNEQNATIAELWDGENLRCTFRRTVNERIMNLWNEIVQIASTISFKDEEDSLIWQYSSSGGFSSQSLYRIVNFRGVQQVFAPAIWKLSIPPRVHIFLWLLSKNKTLTRDNVAKRKYIEDKSFLFCSEMETIIHLFFDCVVARRIWKDLSEEVNLSIGADFESVA